MTNDQVAALIKQAQVDPDSISQKTWDKLGLFGWVQMVTDVPTTIQRCPTYVINNISSATWVWILTKQPTLKDWCKRFNDFTETDWSFLLLTRGDVFRDEYVSWRGCAKNADCNIPGNSWKHILIKFPQLVDLCDLSLLTEGDVEEIVAVHPSLMHIRLILI